MKIENAELKTHFLDKEATITFYIKEHELMVRIHSGILDGSFPVNAKELKILKQLIRRFH